MLVSFLFWNLHGRAKANQSRRRARLLACITRLVAARSIDVLMFAECQADGAEVVQALNNSSIGNYHHHASDGVRVMVLSRLDESLVKTVYSDLVSDRLTIRHLQIGAAPGILLAGVHFFDRNSLPTDAGRTLKMAALVKEIINTEDDIGHQRTVLVGDLNMNPFEGAVVGAGALHGLMTRKLLKSVPRLASRKGHRCFYNPMWSYLGDHRPSGPAGTYFYVNETDPGNHFWNVYDQVLLRPGLADNLASLEVLDTDGQESFITDQGRPRKAALSDHLPLFFKLDL